MAFMSCTDLSAWLGSCDRALSASLDQLILDAEVCKHAHAYLRQFEVNEDTLAVDIMHEVGPGGHFLDKTHTLKHFKREIWSRQLSDTFVLEPATKGSYIERAKAKVKEILAAHTPLPLKENVDKEMQQILKDAENDILGK
jgi:trimethylamine--corrinoid protein Co-methyltransferase